MNQLRLRQVASVSTFAFLLSGLAYCDDVGDGNPRTPRAEYTAEEPGEWLAFRDTHAPRLQIQRDILKIEVPLTRITTDHYIEKIGVMDELGRDVLEPRAYAREDNSAAAVEAQFSIAGLRSERGKLRVYAKCNLHDLWTAPLELP